MKKGVVFTLDAIIAMGIILLTIGIVVSFVSVHSQQNDNTLKLSRMARDVLEISYYYNSGLTDANMPAGVVNLCNDDFQQIGVTPEVMMYDDIATKGTDPRTKTTNKWYYAGISTQTMSRKACVRGLR